MRKRLLFSVAIIPQIILIQVLSHYPSAVEKFYSHGLYKPIAAVAQFLFGSIPFSIGDLLYFILGLLIIRWLYRVVKSKFKSPLYRVLQIFSMISLFYFLFHFLWGLNYYRLPLHHSLGLKTTYSTSELEKLSEVLLQRTNTLQLALTDDRNKKVEFDFSQKELNDLSIKGFDNVFIEFPSLKYRFKRTKASLFSLPLSYMGFSGYLNPLTNEAQYNSKIPKFNQPTTMAHEMGHQLGFAKENEANFMAALATIHHSDPYFDYAGHAFALQYCLSELNRRDRDKVQKLIENLNPGIRKNYQEINTFWDQYENPLEPAFKLFYGNYLKVNNQPEGMKSYSYVVALLVNYYQGDNAL